MRFRSLDLFRGLTVAAMVIVNNPGDWNAVYWPLLHAEWHGWTPTDLIFPFFLFIVGVAMPLGRERSWGTILQRSAIIFALGLFVSGFPFFRLDAWRIPGVLQRIALCYLAGAALLRATRPLTPRARRWTVGGVAAGCLVFYWFLLVFVQVPGGRAGDLSAEGNLGAWLDRQLMAGHLWRPGWDPEGLLSTVPAIATTLMGALAGWILMDARRGEVDRQRGRSIETPVVRVLLAWGAAGVVLGLSWSVVFPLNKSLWTSSYAVFTSGLAAVGLALCYWLVDIDLTRLVSRPHDTWRECRRAAPRWQGATTENIGHIRGRSNAASGDAPPGSYATNHAGGALGRRLTEPFVALGRNALLLFVLSGLLVKAMIAIRWPDPSQSFAGWLYAHVFAPVGPPKVSSLLYAAANLVLLGGICWVLHRRGRYFTA